MRRGADQRISLGVLISVLAGIASAQGPRTDPGAYVPGPNMPMPTYFSGTYNVVRAYVKPYPKPINLPQLPNPQITWIGLKVNGILVEERTEDRDIVHMSVEVSDIIDSTVFAHGSTVTVEVIASDNYNRHYSDVDSASVRNRFPVLAHHHGQPWGVAGVAGTTASHSNYMRTFDMFNGWSRATYLSRLNDASALMVATHGASNGEYIVDDLYTSSPSAQSSRIYESNVVAQKLLQMGSGVPPFNQGSVPLNVLLVLACTVGANPGLFYAHFFPHLNAYTGQMTNQAGHGYIDSIYFNKMINHADVFWSMQAEGRTIAMTVQYMIDLEVALLALCQQSGSPYPGPIFPIGEDPPLPFVNADWGPVWGDPYAKSRGVYTGTHMETLQWHRD